MKRKEPLDGVAKFICNFMQIRINIVSSFRAHLCESEMFNW
jgi:hypothetical protein